MLAKNNAVKYVQLRQRVSTIGFSLVFVVGGWGLAHPPHPNIAFSAMAITIMLVFAGTALRAAYGYCVIVSDDQLIVRSTYRTAKFHMDDVQVVFAQSGAVLLQPRVVLMVQTVDGKTRRFADINEPLNRPDGIVARIVSDVATRKNPTATQAT